jgi:hypothetical protein
LSTIGCRLSTVDYFFGQPLTVHCPQQMVIID